MSKKRGLRCHAVLALRRADWQESIVALQGSEEDAQRVGRRIILAFSRKFFRCRVKLMQLTESQLEAICFRWGREDALERFPLTDSLPEPYAAPYRRGHRAGLEEARRLGRRAEKSLSGQAVTDPLELIEKGCHLALRFGLAVSTRLTGCLDTVDGVYGFAAGAKTYHPLESVLICEEARADGWQADVAAKLGVSAAWVEGFLDGFAQATERSSDQDYFQGFLAAEELRIRRPGLLRG
jgi:hypothetical protein